MFVKYKCIWMRGKYVNREKIVQAATEFYKKLYKKDSEELVEVLSFGQNNKEEVPPILKNEVFSILKKVKVGKVPGPDKIDNYEFKTLAEELAPSPTKIYNLILEEKQIPIQWWCLEIILLFKKGDRNDINKYNPISLNSNPGKILQTSLDTGSLDPLITTSLDHSITNPLISHYRSHSFYQSHPLIHSLTYSVAFFLLLLLSH